MKIIHSIGIVASLVVSAQAQTYDVRLAPPVAVGASYLVSATGHKVQKTSVGDRVVKAADYEIHFEGKAAVLEVDSRSRPVKILFTVDTFTKVEAGKSTALLKAGIVIVADGKQGQPISLQEGSLEEPVREAFQLVYPAHKPNDVTDDDIFGSKEQKSEGERWPMNRSLAVKSFKDIGIVIPEDGLSGTVVLEGKEKMGNVDCLRLRGQMTADSIAAGGLPEGVIIDSGSATAVFRGCFPLENLGLARKESTELKVEIQASSEGTKFKVSVVEKRDAVWTAVAR